MPRTREASPGVTWRRGPGLPGIAATAAPRAAARRHDGALPEESWPPAHTAVPKEVARRERQEQRQQDAAHPRRSERPRTGCRHQAAAKDTGRAHDPPWARFRVPIDTLSMFCAVLRKQRDRHERAQRRIAAR